MIGSTDQIAQRNRSLAALAVINIRDILSHRRDSFVLYHFNDLGIIVRFAVKRSAFRGSVNSHDFAFLCGKRLREGFVKIGTGHAFPNDLTLCGIHINIG